MGDGYERVGLGKDRSRTKQVSKREWLKHGAEKAEVGRRWGRVESYSHSGAAGLALTNNQSLEGTSPGRWGSRVVGCGVSTGTGRGAPCMLHMVYSI